MTAPVIKNQAGYDATGKVYSLYLVYDSANDQWIPGVVDASGNTAVVGNVSSGATDSGNPVKVGAKYNATLPTVADGQRVDLQAGTRGSLNVTLYGVNSNIGATVAGNTSDGVAAATQTLFSSGLGYVYNGTTWDRVSKATTVGRLLSSAATTNGTNVKNAAGTIHKINLNVAVAGKFLKLYNKATAPTVGTDTPVMTIPLAATGAREIDFGPNGLYFATGIGYGITGAIGDADTTAVASGDITGMNILYS